VNKEMCRTCRSPMTIRLLMLALIASRSMAFCSRTSHVTRHTSHVTRHTSHVTQPSPCETVVILPTNA
jgi:hypothetical protein